MQLEVRYLYTISPDEYGQLLSAGWRRQGISFFRPTCPACDKCRSLRIVVDQFKPSKSQRRIWRKNAEVRVEIGTPTFSARHLEIFDAYHRDMQQRRGWDYHCITADVYMELFLSGSFEFAREFRYLRQDELIGVGLVDVTDSCSSSVYFYHAPEVRASIPYCARCSTRNDLG
jgi:arginine-tRNA-protein transferase